MNGGSLYTEYAQMPTLTKEKLDKLLAMEGLPAVDSTDNGKVLMVVDGGLTLATINELPVVTEDDNGKILKVVDGVWTAVEEDSTPEPQPETEE